jgi:hypothetical protein
LPPGLLEALAEFNRRPPQAANRMDPIQHLLRIELQSHFTPLGSLADVRLERPVKGKHRVKNWDVRFTYASRPQLAISTKSIMRNVAGTVPNRIDDAMGECVNVHAHDPGMVLGYLFVMDAAGGRAIARTGQRWADILAESLASFSGRRSERDAPELFEAATLLLVDFQAAPIEVGFHRSLLSWDEFFGVLVAHVRARNPLIDLALSRAPQD